MRDINELKEDFENKKITQNEMSKEEILALKEIYEKEIEELEKKDERLTNQVNNVRRELDELLSKIK